MLKFYLALLIGKCSVIGCKVLGKVMHRGGTNLPGEIALKVCPEFLKYVGKPAKIVTVTGTNGKTTTTNMIADVLEKSGHKILTNRAGGNIASGIATCLMNGVNLFNQSRYPLAVLEVDERSSLRIYPYVKPDYTICTNLFRDSCMRNAHPHFIFDIIEQALPDSTTLFLNADDVISNRLKKDNPRIYYGIDQLPEDRTEPFNILNDMRICPNCQEKLVYDFVRYNQIGHVHCPRCGLTSPAPDFHVTEINYEDRNITIAHGDTKERYPMVSDSIFNIYNELTVVAFLRTFGVSAREIYQALAETKIVDTRYRSDFAGGIHVISTMAKSWIAPAVSVVFDYVRGLPNRKEIILMIEDTDYNVTSSENLTYMYDTDFEFLNDPLIEKIVVVGVRTKDFLLRMLLAGIDREKIFSTEEISKLPQFLSFDKEIDIHIIYDMHQQANYEKIRKTVLDAIQGGGKA